jgi:DnaJ-class molecular chaperone
MPTSGSSITVEQARQRLGIAPDTPASELQGAFRRAMAAARGPDDHVPPDRFRELIDAYRVLRHQGQDPHPAERRYDTWPSQIELTPYEAIVGGPKVGRLPTGRPFETRLPPGLRHLDVIWVWGWLLQVRIDEGDELAVRGDDVWITVRRPRAGVEPGMRLSLDTPTGPFSFRLTQENIDAGLARAPGFGLPARKGHPQGDLYIRLVLEDRPLKPAEVLRKFTKAKLTKAA